jgi:hypothetical protein
MNIKVGAVIVGIVGLPWVYLCLGFNLANDFPYLVNWPWQDTVNYIFASLFFSAIIYWLTLIYVMQKRESKNRKQINLIGKGCLLLIPTHIISCGLLSHAQLPLTSIGLAGQMVIVSILLFKFKKISFLKNQNSGAPV